MGVNSADSALIAGSVYGTGSGQSARVELDLAEGALVIGDVLVQDRGERFGLLRTEINPLKIPDFNLIFRLLLHGAEHQEEVPYIDPHLHTVGVGFAIIRCTGYGEIRLSGDDHR